tara:strand:- start:406 stop:744 length:339 start_codon:yes stop_codon:yes gene_type:complete
VDFEQQLDTEHLLLEDRVCRTCGVSKSLLADFYRFRKDSTLMSSYTYECRDCAAKRVKDRNKKKYILGTCEICGHGNKKLLKNICSKCDRSLIGFNNDIDILSKAVLYLEKS